MFDPYSVLNGIVLCLTMADVRASINGSLPQLSSIFAQSGQ